MSLGVMTTQISSARRVCFHTVPHPSHFAHSIAPQSERHAREPHVGQASCWTHNKRVELTAAGLSVFSWSGFILSVF